jgi:enolase
MGIQLAYINCEGVSKAINNVNKIIGPALVEANFDVRDQKLIDEWLIQLDGTKNKSFITKRPIFTPKFR